ncbi:adhesion G protein-coupled receptor L4-like [Saccostrea cucullata]|uniref:adhesion G protein-coupled receptor L4-like n=1 Tax=Saccostrea cuccullata TaxID=36930 RepID=UPI002ED2CFE0
MIAQVVGFGMPHNEFPLLCKILGFFNHYFWLASFFWMSACSIQMFLLFGRLNIYNMINNSKRLLKYCLYAYGTPILLTGTNIVYSTLSSKGENFGYSLDVCYITYPIMILVTFAVPVFLIIFSNILTFVVVCCRINHHQKINAVQTRYSRSKVLAKLSFLIGSPWIIAFVNYWIRDKILEYIFLALSGSQGLFIMISFVCTRRVFDLLCEKIKRKKKNQNKNVSTRL